MKKLISAFLVLAMLACLIPAMTFTASAAEAPQAGLNATFWHSVAEVAEGETGHADAWRRLMGWHGKGQSTSYETNEWFASSIDQMAKISYKWPTVGDGKLTFGEGFDRDSYKANTTMTGDNDYMVQWTGTMKATTAGTYTFVANAIDNGVGILVDGKLAFEWWGPDSWFENESLLSKYTFTITEDQVGKDIPFEMWFMETFGDERLKMSVTADGTAEGQKSMADAGLTFALSVNYYTLLLKGDEYDDIKQHMQAGNGKDAGDPVNHTFSHEQLDKIKGEMLAVGTDVIDNMESDTFYQKPVFEQFGAHYDCFMIEYEGYLTPVESGTYQFGTHKVDNCFVLQLQINGQWKTVYEFWGTGIWNDESTTYYNESNYLTAGVSYPLRAYFLELDGGEPLVTCMKINGEEKDHNAVLLTTAPYVRELKAVNWSVEAPADVVLQLEGVNADAVSAIKIGKTALKSSDYTVESTSTDGAPAMLTVTIWSDAIGALATGKYTITVEAAEGSATCALTVANDAAVIPPAKTGDGIGLIALLATLSLAGIAIATRKRSAN